MSLFLKIFLWFWGVMTALLLSLLLILGTSAEEGALSSPTTSFYSTVAYYPWRTVLVFQAGHDPALRDFRAKVSKNTGVSVYLFDPQGRPRGLKRTENLPAEVPWLAERARYAIQSVDEPIPQGQFQLSLFRFTAAQPIATPQGNFVFVASASRLPVALRAVRRRTQVLTVAFVFLTTGLLCYGLARYLAAPVGRIRLAAQQISGGDLSARVEPNHVPRGRDEIAGLARDFDTMAGRLQNLVTAQNRLLGDVSHELRSPLARMNLALELARRGDEEKQRNAIERIARESARLDVLIGELLTLSRLENGLRAETLGNEVDLAAVCGEVAADAEFEAQNAGRGVQVTYSGPEEGLIVRGDPELLHRAIENVTRNALRHTADDSTVALSLDDKGNEVVFSIADGGTGVPEAELETIFQPFYRVEGARDRPDGGSGTGLGLAIAQRALAAHGGSISAQNREEGGLLVRLTVPKTRS